MDELPRWMTPDQAAKYLQVSRGTLYNMVRLGTIPKPRALTPRTLRYDRDAIDRALGGVIEEKREPTLGDIDWGPDDREARKRAWQDEREGRENRRPWAARERREREERLAKRKAADK
jgi:excisionase family DNA binding protein